MPAMGVLTDRHTRDFKTRQKLDGMLSPVWEHQGRLLKGGDTGLNINITGVQQAKTVSLNNTASSYHEHSGLKVYWWGGEEGE